jgi:hypothetical protein
MKRALLRYSLTLKAKATDRVFQSTGSLIRSQPMAVITGPSSMRAARSKELEALLPDTMEKLSCQRTSRPQNYR